MIRYLCRQIVDETGALPSEDAAPNPTVKDHSFKRTAIPGRKRTRSLVAASIMSLTAAGLVYCVNLSAGNVFNNPLAPYGLATLLGHLPAEDLVSL